MMLPLIFLASLSLPAGEVAYMRGGTIYLSQLHPLQEAEIAKGDFDRPLAWSPDGKSLAFWKHVSESWSLHIWSSNRVVDLTSAHAKDARSASFSSDGRQIAFTSGEKGLCIINADGSGFRVLAADAHRDAPPCFLQNGRIAYSNQGDEESRISVIEVASGRKIAEWIGNDPASANGSEVFYTRSSGRGHCVFSRRLDTNEEKRLTPESSLAYRFALRPDGQGLAYVDESGNQAKIVIHPFNTAAKVVARITGNAPRTLSWSRDGKHLAYVNGNRDSEEVWVVNVQESTREKIASGSWPAWRPSGN